MWDSYLIIILTFILGLLIGYALGRYGTVKTLTKLENDDVPFKFGDKYYFVVLDKVFYRLKNK